MKTVKICFVTLLVLIVLFLLASVVTGCVILANALGSAGNVDYLVVLGTTVEGSKPSAMLSDRIQAAARYLDGHKNVTCIVTGYKAEDADISEAQCMFNELVALGIEPSRILLEEEATSTKENFRYSLALIEEREGKLPKKVGVVSSEFHLYRAKMLANHFGVEAVTIPALSSDGESFAKYFLREIFVLWREALLLKIGK